MVSTLMHGLFLRDVMGSSVESRPSVRALLDPVRSWEWPVKVSANFQRSLSSFETPESCAIRRVQTDDGTFWLMALRNHHKRTALPPHPGNPPSQLNTMTVGGYGFMDGSLGRFDIRRYPQVFRTDSPWRGFVISPNSDNTKSRPEYDCPLLHWCAREQKWDWPWIQLLYRRRFKVVEGLSTFMRNNSGVSEYLKSSNYTFPPFDEAEQEDFIEEVVFSETIQLIGHTQRWIAEADAILQWLARLRPWEHPLPAAIRFDVYDGFQGCWLPSDISPDDEALLAASAIPIFVALRVREVEPLELENEGLDFSNGEYSRPYLTSWFLQLQHLSPTADPRQTQFPQNLHWEQPVIGSILPTLPVFVTSQDCLRLDSLESEHIACDSRYGSMLGPWGCPQWMNPESNPKLGEYDLYDDFYVLTRIQNLEKSS
jgi:hypothetical protein